MIRRGELYYADLSPVVGSEQGGVRPVLIVQNDVGNKFRREYGLVKDSVVLLEQIRTLDKRRLKDRIGVLPQEVMKRIDAALMISLGMGSIY